MPVSEIFVEHHIDSKLPNTTAFRCLISNAPYNSLVNIFLEQIEHSLEPIHRFVRQFLQASFLRKDVKPEKSFKVLLAVSLNNRSSLHPFHTHRNDGGRLPDIGPTQLSLPSLHRHVGITIIPYTHPLQEAELFHTPSARKQPILPPNPSKVVQICSSPTPPEDISPPPDCDENDIFPLHRIHPGYKDRGSLLPELKSAEEP
jgi:hypothetical protein